MGFRINFKCNTFNKNLFMGKKVVGIAMGGNSSERELSLESGSTVFQFLPSTKCKCFKIVVDFDLWTVIDAQENTYFLNLENFTFEMEGKTVHFDVIFNAIHGAPGEDGQLAKKLAPPKAPSTRSEET